MASTIGTTLYRILLTVSLGLYGCVPGMQMGDIGNASQEPSIAAAADIIPISARTIAELRDAREATKPVNEVGLHEVPDDYIVGPEDILRVTFWEHPELNNPGATITSSLSSLSISTGTPVSGTPTNDSTSRVVDTNGNMFYPYVGTVHVAGKTTGQIQAFITNALQKTFKNPQVEVVVASYRSKRIYITGEVRTPGSLPISDVRLHITDAVAASGGVTSNADLTDVSLARGPNHTRIDLYSLLYLGDLTQNYTLMDGDILNVPEQRFNKIFVLGEVVKAGSILMPRGRYTLAEALADAGGANQSTANASQIFVIRNTAGRPRIYYLDSNQPAGLLLADQFDLQPRDVVFVDAAGAVRFGRVISQVLPIATVFQAGKYVAD